MTKLKVVFHVEDEAGNNVVEKSQTMLVVGDDPDVALTVAELARNHIAEERNELKACAKTHPQKNEEDIEAIVSQGQTYKRRRVIDDIMEATGIIICRHIRLKLRDWARGHLETV